MRPAGGAQERQLPCRSASRAAMQGQRCAAGPPLAVRQVQLTLTSCATTMAAGCGLTQAVRWQAAGAGPPEPKRKRRHRLFGGRRKEPQRRQQAEPNDNTRLARELKGLASSIRDTLSAKHRQRKAQRKAAADEAEVGRVPLVRITPARTSWGTLPALGARHAGGLSGTAPVQRRLRRSPGHLQDEHGEAGRQRPGRSGRTSMDMLHSESHALQDKARQAELGRHASDSHADGANASR